MYIVVQYISTAQTLSPRVGAPVVLFYFLSLSISNSVDFDIVCVAEVYKSYMAYLIYIYIKQAMSHDKDAKPLDADLSRSMVKDFRSL